MKRFYSHTQAVDYFGAGRKWFDREIAPNVTWTQAGPCKLVDRVDLDRAWDDYQARRQGEQKPQQEEPWHAEARPASTKKRTARGKSTSSSNVYDFDAAFETIMKRKPGSPADAPR